MPLPDRFDFIKENPDGNYAVQQGATFNHVLTVFQSNGSAVDLTGYSARMKIKRDTEAPTTLASWTSGGGEIVVGTTDGTITFAVTDIVTAALSWLGLAKYDLEIESMSGTVYRLIEGDIELSREVTD